MLLFCIQVTILYIQVTILYIQVTILYIQVTILYIQVTILYIQVIKSKGVAAQRFRRNEIQDILSHKKKNMPILYIFKSLNACSDAAN